MPFDHDEISELPDMAKHRVRLEAICAVAGKHLLPTKVHMNFGTEARLFQGLPKFTHVKIAVAAALVAMVSAKSSAY